LTNYTQQEIIRGCKIKDPRFQKALVIRYAGLLMGVSQRYTRDKAFAKDVLQEAYIQILKSITDYQEQGQFEAWMKRIVINMALKYFDKSSFKNELYTIDNVPERGITPDAYSNLASDELLVIINRIPKNYRTIFNLHAIEGYSHKEISELLGIKESTSRSQLTRARTMLRKLFAKNENIKLRI